MLDFISSNLWPIIATVVCALVTLYLFSGTGSASIRSKAETSEDGTLGDQSQTGTIPERQQRTGSRRGSLSDDEGFLASHEASIDEATAPKPVEAPQEQEYFAREVEEWIETATTASGKPLLRGKNHKTDNAWTEPPARGFKVRGKDYLTTKKKGASRPEMFRHIGMNPYMIGEHGAVAVTHLASKVPSLRGHIEARPESFFIILGWMIPGPPYRTVAMVWEQVVAEGVDPVFDKMLHEFVHGTDEQRKARFKYLPRLDDAPRMVLSGVKMAGGEKPTMLANKLDSSFFTGPNYIEVDIDIASSKVANMVAGLIIPKITKVVVSHAIMLEGHCEEELPERVLGTVRTQTTDMIGSTVVLPPDGAED